MTNLPQPKPVRLGEPGLYILPEAVGFPSLVVVQGQLPVRLHFALTDDTEFHLPLSQIALERLCGALTPLFSSQDNRLSARQVSVQSVAETPTFEWDDTGKTVTVDFLADDGTAVVLAMPVELLRSLRSDIDDALARRPQPN
jgi:hypothetical protein